MLLAFAKVAGYHVITWLVIGAVAGALAGKVTRDEGFGLVRDTIVGLVGAILGGLALHALRGTRASSSIAIEIIVAFVGAVVLVAIARAISPGERRSLSRT